MTIFENKLKTKRKQGYSVTLKFGVSKVMFKTFNEQRFCNE
jgi:hypothetical protein